MPKLKTHSGAKKRFSATRTGKIKSRAASRGHRLVSKSKSSKRNKRSTKLMSEPDKKSILHKLMPYSVKKLRNMKRKLKSAVLIKKKEAA